MERTDQKHRGHVIRVYNNELKPGQLKVEQIAILLDEERLIAADRDSVVTDLIDAIEGEATTEPISKQEDYAIVMSQSKWPSKSLHKQAKRWLRENGLHVPSRWVGSLENHWTSIVVTISTFSTCLRIKVLMRSKQQVELAIGGDPYDVLHRGYILAPPVTEEASKYELPLNAAPQRTSCGNTRLGPSRNRKFGRMNVRIEEAFWV